MIAAKCGSITYQYYEAWHCTYTCHICSLLTLFVWRFLDGKCSDADIASRGQQMSELKLMKASLRSNIILMRWKLNVSELEMH